MISDIPVLVIEKDIGFLETSDNIAINIKDRFSNDLRCTITHFEIRRIVDD